MQVDLVQGVFNIQFNITQTSSIIDGFTVDTNLITVDNNTITADNV